MEVLNYSEFRKNMKENLDKVSDNNETVIISRNNNRGVVVISLNEYNAIEETLYLMKSNKNRERIDETLEEIKQEKGFQKSLLEE